MSRFSDVWNKLLGPGHMGKAQIDKDQDTFHWPFVTLTYHGRNRWKLDIYFEPNFPRSQVLKRPPIHLRFLSKKEALKRAADENRAAAERFVARKKEQRQQRHDSLARTRSGGHFGTIQQCPVCQSQQKRRKPRGTYGER